MKVIHIKELFAYLFPFHLKFSVINVNEILIICKRNPIDYSTLIMLYQKDLFIANLIHVSRLWTYVSLFFIVLKDLDMSIS